MKPARTFSRRVLRHVSVALGLALAAALRAQPDTGTIEGRVSRDVTGDFIEGARVSVEGTTLETSTDADGNFRLSRVPAGTVRLKVFYTGLPLQTVGLGVTAGQTARQDIHFAALAAKATADGMPIKLDEFVVATSREMSGAALAINEQRFAPNLKNVVATDEFGDIAEGNVAEFVKFMPGVTIDYGGGNARGVSLNGVPAAYTPVTLDGFSVASAVGGGAGGTTRTVAVDQISINNLARIEVSFSPTPESQGMALAGSVNMVPRSSFERARAVFTGSAYVMMRDDAKDFKKTPAPRKPTRKVHPGFDFSYVAPVSRRFGYTLSAGFSRQYSGEPRSLNTWRGASAATNGDAFPHTTFDQPYLSSYAVRNSGKDTKRSSFGLTIDYKLGSYDRLTFAFTYSTFDVLINHNELTFNVNRVRPGDFTTRSTHGAVGAGDLVLGTIGADRANLTYMPSLIWRHTGTLWKSEAGASLSRGRNRNYNTSSGFFDTTTARRSGVTVSFDEIFYLRPQIISVTDGATGQPVDPYSLRSYAITAAQGNTRATDDTQRQAYANAGRDFHGRVPLSLKAGVDVRQAVRDLRATIPAYTYVGADGRASSTPVGSDDRADLFLDPSFSDRIAPYGFPRIQGISSEKLYEHFLANPGSFTPNANNNYRSTITNSKRAEEVVSALFLRGDLQLFERRLKLTGGVRGEQTNIDAEGALADPSRNIQRNAQGAPILGPNGRPLPITMDALQTSILTFIDRGARAEKEYLRLFPSLNASVNVRDNLIARAAIYTSVGRPDFNQYAGGITVPDPENPPSASNQIVVSNVAIKAWSARTLNARLEYYFEGVGEVSVGAFRREFENFFGNAVFPATPAFLALYGLDPAIYGSYDVATQHNLASKVRGEGLNVNYRQALTFLPSWARGVQVFANGSAQRMIGEASANFAGYVPRSGSWGISISRPKYTVRANWNYRGRQRRGLVATGASIEPGTYNWGAKRLYLDVSGEYYVWRRVAVFANLRNIGDAPDDFEITGPSTPAHAQFRERTAFGSLWMFGLKGTF